MRPRLLLVLLLAACAIVIWLCAPAGYQWYVFVEQESGVLSNGWEYALYEHRFSDEPRFLLKVVESDGVVRRLQASRVEVAPQSNGTTAIHFGVKKLAWESPGKEWWDLLDSPGLFLDSQRKN